MNLRRAGRQVMRVLTAPLVLRFPLRVLARLNLLPMSVWQRLPVEGRIRIRLNDGTNFHYGSTPGDGIARVIYWRGMGAWEEETVDVFSHMASQVDVIVDVGANTGIYTLIGVAANATAKVYAFEPVPRIYERLRENVALNNWQQRCVLHQIALADRNGRTSFHVPHFDLPSSASLHLEGFGGAAGELIEVDVRTFDSVCPDIAVDLVKIDVEGFEHQVLMGMRATLARCEPAIVVECNPGGPLSEVERILADHGYVFFHVTRRALVRKASIEADALGHARNYLCLTERRLPLIAGRT